MEVNGANSIHLLQSSFVALLLGIDFQKLSARHKRNHTSTKTFKNIFM